MPANPSDVLVDIAGALALTTEGEGDVSTTDASPLLKSLHFDQDTPKRTSQDANFEWTSSPRGNDIPAVMELAISKGLISEQNPVALFMNVGRLRAKAISLHNAFPETVQVCHAYAVKANPLSGVMQEILKLGGGAECASIFEVEHAIRQGFDPSKVVLDSPCKTADELKRCFDLGCLVNLDCMEEAAKVASFLDAAAVDDPFIKQRVRVGVRLNPQVGGGSIACTSTATATSKFGVGLHDYHDELLAAFCKHEWLTGLHCHVGSQGCEMQLLVNGVKVMYEFAEEINAACGTQRVRILDIGGGLPVNYHSDEEFPTYQEYVAALKEQVPGIFSGLYQLYTEFGRSLVQKAGFIASRIEYTKIAGGRNIATVHCGSNMMLRTCYLPAQWAHEVCVLDSKGHVKVGGEKIYDIAGPLCFSSDVIANKRTLPAITPGDHLVIHDCGGYTFGMYSRYNSRPAPPVYAFNDSMNPREILTWKKGETFEEVASFWG
jgi:diaminopimelate decarboxylase